MMGFVDLLRKVENSKIYRDFIKNHENATLCAGFFILDFVSNDNKQTLDYRVGEDIFTFSIIENDEIIMSQDKLIQNQDFPKLSEISKKIEVDIEDLKGCVEIKMLDEGISKNKIQKIIAVLQSYQDKDYLDNKQIQVWNLTCILEGLQILHVLIDSQSKKADIIKFEKKSMADFMRKVK